MADVICDNCGRAFESPEGGEFLGGDPEWEQDCNHCQFCMYEDCHIWVNKLKWLCGTCKMQPRMGTDRD